MFDNDLNVGVVVAEWGISRKAALDHEAQPVPQLGRKRDLEVAVATGPPFP